MIAYSGLSGGDVAEIDDLEDLARAEVKFGKSRSYALKFEEAKERSKRAA